MSKSDRKHNLAARFVDDQTGLDDAVRDLEESSRFAFDAEFVAEDAYGSELCLLQVATDQHVWIIDPLAEIDVSAFWAFVTNPQKIAVVHAGAEDLALCYRETGKVPQNVFDLQIAAGLVSTDYPISLQRLIRGELGLQLPKSQTLTNWRRRPLTPKQIQYAIEDVAYMLPIHDRLIRKLEKKNRLEWSTQEHRRFEKVSLYEQKDDELYRNIKGAGALSPRGLAIVRELAVEREKLAQSYNRPRRGVLKDYLLVEIARHAWTKPEDIQSLRGMSLKHDALVKLTRAVQRALDQPSDSWPVNRRPPEQTPREAALTKLLSAVLQDFCERESVAAQLLGTNRDIRSLVRQMSLDNGDSSGGALACGWRRDAVGQILDDVISGKRAIRIAPSNEGPTIVVE